MPKCLICHKNNAVKIEPFGYLPCKSCRKRQHEISAPTITGEITTDEIREERKKHQKDIVQPFRDGILSKEYAKVHPDVVQKMVTEGHVSEQDVREAKNVWDLNYYKDND
jgi:hypothetical protein